VLREGRVQRLVRAHGGHRGKRRGAPDDERGWDWGAIYSAIATATGWRFPDIDELSLDDLADLWTYWGEHPPVHLQLQALAGAWGAKRTSRTRSAAPSGAADGAGSMEAIAAILGPPSEKFRHRCRMLPVQASAQAPDQAPDPLEAT
jgi:hypothetical protein